MSKHTKKKAKNRKDRTILTVALALTILAIFIALIVWLANRPDKREAQQPDEAEELPSEDATDAPRIEIPFEIPGFTLLQEAEVGELEGGLELLGVGRYTGEYFEDGSDEPVEDVYAVVLRNNGEDWVDFAAITMNCSDRALSFELASLPGSTCVLVLEAERRTWNEGDRCFNPHAAVTEDDAAHVYSFEDDFELYPSDGVLNLKNISEKTFENGASVFYKSYDYGLFLGGVTYRANFSALEPGAIGQSIQPHYSDARSMILYMTYEG